ncbi:hypothetical protein PsorP6_015189 [Peronosclerospora sorghi]|uniref:Uncharacterized protein n=1 Tax=Peronosclerospora sorghi TaxID=230839 RepID=A0ACC0VRW5_9STRA|nr:hypothetical protein PsorP6_015189 [Peronosclerospora sorghi]
MQLMELQERYERKLTIVRKDWDAVLKKVVTQMQEERKELKPLEHMVQTWRYENKRLKQQMMQLVTNGKWIRYTNIWSRWGKKFMKNKDAQECI